METGLEALLWDPFVQGVVGTVKKLSDANGEGLHGQLRRYVDSKEKNDEMVAELWPLVKNVHIYVRAEALKTGAVLVDLPGVEDANRARTEVAQRYRSKCNHMWIVAPTIRAVDGKMVQDLLEESYRNSHHRDYMLDSTTIICTKADEVSNQDAAGLSGIKVEIDALQAEANQFSIALGSSKQVKQHLRDVVIKTVKARKVECDKVVNACDNLINRLNAGVDVWALINESPNKRKRTAAAAREARKKTCRGDEDSDPEYASSDSSETEDEDDFVDFIQAYLPAGAQERRLTEQDLIALRNEFKTEKKTASARRRELTKEMSKLQEQINEQTEAEKTILSKIGSICLQASRKYVTDEMRRMIVRLIEAYDQEDARSRNEASFDPDVPLRDYQRLGEQLDVFVVSSKAYHHLQGKDIGKTWGNHRYCHVNDTQIPRLQQFTAGLTQKNRETTVVIFLGELLKLLNGMIIQATSPTVVLSAEESAALKALNDGIKQDVETLHRTLRDALRSSFRTVGDLLRQDIGNALRDSADWAAAGALSVADQWSSRRDAGGVAYQTYKAACRRGGSYRDSCFNEKLCAPLIRTSQTRIWKEVFGEKIPAALHHLRGQSADSFTLFRRTTIAKIKSSDIKVPRLEVLNSSVKLQQRALQQHFVKAADDIKESPKSIDQTMVDVVRAKMQPTYRDIEAFGGRGAFKRIRDKVHDDIDSRRDVMFEEAAEAALTHLVGVWNTTLEEAEAAIYRVLHELRDLYGQVIVGAERQSSTASRQVNQVVAGFLTNIDSRFIDAMPPREDSSDDEHVEHADSVANMSTEYGNLCVENDTEDVEI